MQINVILYSIIVDYLLKDMHYGFVHCFTFQSP